MAELFPWRPLAGSGETIDWLTDVLGSRTSEQRLGLRARPRRGFDYALKLDSLEYSRAKAFSRRNGLDEVAVPAWVEHTNLGATVANGATEILFDPAYAGYQAGGLILVWESDTHAVAAEIATVEVDRVTLDAALDADYVNATVAPCHLGLMVDGLKASRRRGLVVEASVRIECDDTGAASGASGYPTYLSIEVMTDTPARVGDLSEQIVRTVEKADAGLGPFEFEPTRAFAEFAQTLGFLEQGKAGLWRRRAWLHALDGRRKPFWLPSFRNDLRLAVAAGATDTTLDVVSIGPTGFYPGRHVMLQRADGTRHFREITNAASLGGGLDRLTIDANLGTALDPADVRLFSFLSKVRLATDRVSIRYPHTDLATMTIAVTEVPE